MALQSIYFLIFSHSLSLGKVALTILFNFYFFMNFSKMVTLKGIPKIMFWLNLRNKFMTEAPGVSKSALISLKTSVYFLVHRLLDYYRNPRMTSHCKIMGKRSGVTYHGKKKTDNISKPDTLLAQDFFLPCYGLCSVTSENSIQANVTRSDMFNSNLLN